MNIVSKVTAKGGPNTPVSNLVPLMLERADAADKLGHLTEDVVQAMHAAGVFKAYLPKGLGGDDLSHIELYDMLLSLARGSASAAWIALVGGNNLDFALTYPEDTLREVIDVDWPGPLFAGAVFNPGHVTATARHVDGGAMVKGTWQFCSGIHHAKYLIGGVRYAGDPELYCVLVPQSEGRPIDDWQVVGLRASSSHSFEITEEVFVPQRRIKPIREVVGELDGLFARHGKQRTIPSNAIAVGAAYGALDIFIAQAKKKKPSGMPVATMAEAPIIQSAVGQAWAEITAAEAIGRMEASADPTQWDGERAILGGLHSQYAARRCADSIDALHHLMGSSAIYDRNPLQRSARDLRALCLHPLFRSDLAIYNIGRMVFGQEPTALFAEIGDLNKGIAHASATPARRN
jgi:alkylation response protein AidB-like acyl-CoA dehydrogenase